MVRVSQLVLAAVSLALLAACATPGPSGSAPLATASITPGDSDASIYGLYLAGQAALDSGDSRAATALFARAADKQPDALYLKDRVLTAALMSGDVQRAASLAPSAGDASSGDRILGVMAQTVEALAEGRGEEAYQRLVKSGDLGRGGSALALLKPWAAAAAGRTEASLAMPALDDRLTRMIASIDQGLLMERAHRYADAETTFKALLPDHAALPLVAAAYGPYLERRGRRQDAIALYDQVLAIAPDDADMLAARARAAAKAAPPPPPTIREGAAQALMVPAAVVLANKEQEVGLIYLRLALRLDPNQSEAWLLVGDALNGLNDPEGARQAFAQVGPKSSHYVDARTRLAWSYQADDMDQAMKLAQETVQQRPDSQDAKLTLADLMRADDRFAESAKLLDDVIARAGPKAEWRLYYMRGVALERSGQWPDAERDLKKALEMQPNSPEVLNYLGYSWVNRGTHIQEGLKLIEKALTLQPDEGAYVDSLGWAYYRLGDYKKAVGLLERAATLDAGDAEINDHLGDAYWRAGRHDEARFQWRAVLTMKPPAGIKASAQMKLDSPDGVDAVAAKPETVAAK
jgi:tetratricopeptide (TPR) repeat protein